MGLKRIFIRVGYLFFLLVPTPLFASFIEATMGTAVVNDATATYYNPAALTLLKSSQIIGLGSYATLQTNFNGQATQSLTGFTQSGSSSTQTHYYLPSLYVALPSSDKLTVGLAVISNFFNNNIDDNSVLRYAKSSSNVKNLDINPAIGIKLNKMISLGAAISFSYADFLLQPTSGFPSLEIPDSKSRNESSGYGVGGDVGVLLTVSPSTLIGLNYRSATTYKLSGTSTIESHPAFTSNNYYFDFWTPAREVLTISHFVNPALGFISTIQYVQWGIFDEVSIHNIAARMGSKTVIIDGEVPFHLHDSWLFTFGGQYRMNQQWIVRVAATYVQSPGNPHYQIANGDSYVVGASVGYEVFKNIILDGSYAHAFMQDEDIAIATGRNEVSGVNAGSRDAVSLKLTVNLT